jgi:hypothetical protein
MRFRLPVRQRCMFFWECAGESIQAADAPAIMAFSVAATNCIEGTVDCDGSACVDINSDNENCGKCGIACSDGQTCIAGQCVPSCEAGLTNCVEFCADTNNDPANCGEYGHICETGQSCINGQCTGCDTSEIDCNGACCPTGQACCDDTCTTLRHYIKLR